MWVHRSRVRDTTAQTCVGSRFTRRKSQTPHCGPAGPEQGALLPHAASSALARGSSRVTSLALPCAWNVLPRHLPGSPSLLSHPLSSIPLDTPICNSCLCFSPQHLPAWSSLHPYLAILGPLPFGCELQEDRKLSFQRRAHRRCSNYRAEEISSHVAGELKGAA